MQVRTTAAGVLLLLGQIAATMLLAPAARGEIVDRIVAVVEPGMLGGPPTTGEIITWSAAYEQACYQAFQKGDPPPQWSAAQVPSSPGLRELLSRMIDERLLHQALNRSPFAPSGEGDFQGRMQAIADKYPDAETFRKELERYHLTEAALLRRLTRENLLMAFVDSTLRPDVRIASEEIESYYQSKLLPQLESAARGAGPSASLPPLADVRPQIQEILTQQEIDRRLEQWLQQLRRAARIEFRLE
ncbi:MAG: hypothetical protein HY651_02175 [Acidobacteria bacterium]|nr:hypothetical protein [Acidobacteriota bacterium]